MTRVGTITNIASGIWVEIPSLKAEYGPLAYLGEAGDYSRGDRVAVTSIGPDEYIVLGVLRP